MNDSIFSKDILLADSGGGKFLKGEDILGRQLRIISVDIATGRNPKYCAIETSPLVKHKILKVGETLRYIFETKEGEEKWYESTSIALYIGFKKANVKSGMLVSISKEGKTDKTRYTVTNLEDSTPMPEAEPTVTEEPPIPDEEESEAEPIDAEKIPF